MSISINTSYQSNIQDLYAKNTDQTAKTNQSQQIKANEQEEQNTQSPLRDQINEIKQQTFETMNNIALLQIANNALSSLSDDANKFGALSNANLQNDIKDLMNNMQSTIDNALFNGQSVFGGVTAFANGNFLNLNAPNLSELNPNNPNSVESFINSLNSTRSSISEMQTNLMQNAENSLQSLATNAQNPATNAIFNAHNPQILQTQISALIS